MKEQKKMFESLDARKQSLVSKRYEIFPKDLEGGLRITESILHPSAPSVPSSSRPVERNITAVEVTAQTLD